MAAYLHHGYMNISINMISSSYSRVSLQTIGLVNDGSWKDLAIKRTESRVEITLNGKVYQLKYTIPGNTSLLFGSCLLHIARNAKIYYWPQKLFIIENIAKAAERIVTVYSHCILSLLKITLYIQCI